MLVTAHVGYTVGCGLVARRARLRQQIDFRLLAFMSLLPDFVDRFLYLFVFRDATQRLIAHTVLFNLVVIGVLLCLRRDLWIYGLASLGHLLLDGETLALQHALWPLLGAELANVGITATNHAGAASHPHLLERVSDILTIYRLDLRQPAQLRAALLELGGVAILVGFAIRHGLYRAAALRRFLMTGEVDVAGERNPPATGRETGAGSRADRDAHLVGERYRRSG